MAEYWNDVIGARSEYNLNEPLVRHWQRSVDILAEELDEGKGDTQGRFARETMWDKALQKVRSWKALGHDGMCVLVEIFPQSCNSAEETNGTDC